MGSRRTVIETKDRFVVAVGQMGPPGAAGAETISRTASEAISAYRAVVSSGAEAVALASNTNPAHRDIVLGITEQAAVQGDTLRVRRIGQITHAGWAWTTDQLIFVGVNGALTQTPPVAPAVFTQAIAVALSATSLYVWPREPMNIL